MSRRRASSAAQDFIRSIFGRFRKDDTKRSLSTGDLADNYMEMDFTQPTTVGYCTANCISFPTHEGPVIDRFWQAETEYNLLEFTVFLQISIDPTGSRFTCILWGRCRPLEEIIHRRKSVGSKKSRQLGGQTYSTDNWLAFVTWDLDNMLLTLFDGPLTIDR